MQSLIEDKILIYIREQIKRQKPLEVWECKEFLEYLGLDRNNLRQMLRLEKPFKVLSEQNYRWDHIYGKNPILDLNQYMKESVANIQDTLEKKKAEILNQIEEYMFPAIIRKGDAYFAVQMLERENESGLYRMLLKEKETDYTYLKDINKRTYEVIKEESVLAKKERGGFWGRREERLADLLASVDDFIQQRYEIYRYKTLEEIYQIVLNQLEGYWVVFPEGTISGDLQSVFEKRNLSVAFEKEYLKTLNIRQVLNNLSCFEMSE